MKSVRMGGWLMVASLAAWTIVMVGCNSKVDVSASAKNKPAKTKEVAEKPTSGHDHSGWWCGEHGIPEEECSMCSSKVAKECKDNGDWCEKHDRAKSQCFICEPALKEKFAAKYRAKYGKEPPPMEEEKKDEAPKKDGK